METNIIYNECCLKGMEKIPDNSIDMILCDLPYGITICGWDHIIPFDKLWKQYNRIIKIDGAIILTASQPFSSMVVMSNLNNFKHEWIWKKNAGSNFGCIKFQPMKEHESVLIFCNGKLKYKPQMQERAFSGKKRIQTKVRSNTTNYIDGVINKFNSITTNRPYLRYPSSVQNFNRERGLHPTQKPVLLFEYFIKTYSKEKELILDNCIGSGTTAIACLNTGRKYIGFEKNKKYYDIAINRINDYFKNKTDSVT